MVQGNSEAVSKQTLPEALRHAASNDLDAMRSVLEADANAAEVAQRYADVAQALYRERKNVTQMLAVAKAGIAYCLDAAERAAATDPVAAATLKTKAKVIAYNAAANSWPGWGDEGIVIAPSHIEDGLDLAQQSLELVGDLKLGHRQVGTSQWLVGALHLAAGRGDDAIVALTRALAVDHVNDGIRVNAVCPGTVDTPWVRRLVEDAGESLDDVLYQPSPHAHPPAKDEQLLRAQLLA